MSNSTITGGPRPVYFLMNPTSAQNRKRVARSPKITHADKSGRVRSVQKPERRKKELPANMTHCNLEAEAEESRNLDPKKEHEDYVPQVSERTLQWVRSQRHTNVNIEYEEHLAVFRKRRAMRRAAMGQTAVPGNAGVSHWPNTDGSPEPPGEAPIRARTMFVMYV